MTWNEVDATIKRIRAEHKREPHNLGDYCGPCSQDYLVPWPCDAIDLADEVEDALRGDRADAREEYY